jgi:ribosomal-protein-alanine N-acetyltransferase
MLAVRDVIGDAVMGCPWWAKRPRLAGFVLSRRVLDEAEILTIAVAVEFRRKGLGGALLGAHIARLAAMGVKELFLEVEAGNAAARALYASFGFHQVGERRGYYRKSAGPAATALVLRRNLG